ncbi:MAG: hypothetical protein ACOZNI_12885 [Myxococcota bacterium]
MLALVLSGCHDYRLEGAPTKPAGEDAETGTTPVTELTCPDLALPAAEPLADPDPTCGAVKVMDWELTIEHAVHLGDGEPYYSAPVVVPLTLGAAPSIVLLSGYDGELWAIDGRTGALDVLEPMPNDIEFIAWGFSAATGERVVAIGDDVDWGVSVSTAPGVWTHAAVAQGVAPGLRDVDRDGVPEILFGGTVRWLDGTVVELPTRFRTLWEVAYGDGVDGAPTFLTGDGHYALEGTQLAQWPESAGQCNISFLQTFPVYEGATSFLAVDGLGPLAMGLDGRATWSGISGDPRGYPEESGMAAALGDTDGDGAPDLCVAVDDRVVVVSADGTVLLDAPTGTEGAWRGAGCALADLDADDNYEVISLSLAGLRLYDVETAALLAHRDDVCGGYWEAPPVVADVDGDDSAEIVVTGSPCDGSPGASLFVIGPQSGRWARTRPIWNQAAYDPTVVADDGTIVTFPRSNPETLRAYRAQPARDGARPDLVPEGLDACAVSCEDGTVEVSVRVLNKGSVEAPAGTRIALYAGDTTFAEVASATLTDPVPAGWASAAVTLEVPVSEWGDQQLLEVAGADECDVLNDRIELSLPDPCP